MASSAELAMKEASDSGLLLGGATVSSVRADRRVDVVRQLRRSKTCNTR